MNYFQHIFTELGVKAEVAAYETAGAREWHVIVHVEPRGDLFEAQMKRLYEAEDRLPALLGGARYVMKRYFVSDSANQCAHMREESLTAISTIQQPPLDGSKIAVWLYLVSDMELEEAGETVVAAHNGYRHLWRMGMHHSRGNSYTQTECVLIDYEQELAALGATLERNCVRTWFFVRDVDTQYQGMVKARLANFVGQGLTPKTHYIASTGIGALPTDAGAIVQFGAYALLGFEKEQLRYLYAPSHLNPTYEYGVTFERGTAIQYGDRRHVFISGTASIDNKGEVLHAGDIVRQTERVWENVGVLLEEAGTSFDDVAQMVVYLRDVADYAVVREMFRQRFPSTPTVIALAPVCRPAWLIEMECMAVKAGRDERFRDF